ncbi:MAG: hypothetical protein RI571_11745, partial [Roseovarius sp.]|nr:hypothetical protein [Roseovarius sp.]
MIPRSRSILVLCTVAAAALHALGLWQSTPRSEIEVAAGAGAAEAVQGNSVEFTLSGGEEGDYHLVAIARSEFRDIWSG